MAARKGSGVLALDVEGCVRYPDLTGFKGTLKDRVMCDVVGCGVAGRREEVWVLEHLAGHPYECPESGCDRVFTRENMLSRHARTHGKLYDVVEGETERERRMRMRLKRRDALAEVGMTDAA